MFTINIKGKANPKDPKMVKLEMIIFKTGYARATKILNISDPFKDWDNKAQSFKGNNSSKHYGPYQDWSQKTQSFVDKESSETNKFLRQEKLKDLKIGERWVSQGKDLIPVELSQSAIDVCLLTGNQIKDDMIIHDRTKYDDKQARVIIIDKASEIIERYRDEVYTNYVFPAIKDVIRLKQSHTVEGGG